ncbi:unnamed protein product, partial [Ectocarpus sp. 13 AM-2016]
VQGAGAYSSHGQVSGHQDHRLLQLVAGIARNLHLLRIVITLRFNDAIAMALAMSPFVPPGRQALYGFRVWCIFLAVQSADAWNVVTSFHNGLPCLC